MSSSYLPLLATIPLLMVGITAILRFKVLDRLLLLAVPVLTMAGGLLLLERHRTDPVIAHHVGDFIGGIAIVFVSDALTAILLVTTGLVTVFGSIYLMVTGEDRYRFVPPLVLMLTTGVNGALLTGDLFNLFVWVEVMLLPSYALIAVTGTWRRLGIGRMFILVNLVASLILVSGVGLVYAAAGTVNLAALNDVGMSDNRVALAVGVVMFAMLIKAGAVPVHSWLPRAYPATSAGIMAIFSGLHTKIGIYTLYRIYTTVFAPNSQLNDILLVIVVATTLIGAVSTFAERRIRGALAYQMISGVGQILIGLVVFTQFSIAAGLFYMVHHMITMAALIMGAGAIEETYGSGRFDRIHGLLRREPLLAAIMAIGFLSLVGLPPTSGVWAKIFLLGSAASTTTAELIALVTAVVLGSVLSMLALQYVWRRVFFGPPMKDFLPDDPVTARGQRTPITDDTKVRGRLMVPPLALVAVSVSMFFMVGYIWPFFEMAGASLMDTSVYAEAVFGR